jgi:hypothetical protein
VIDGARAQAAAADTYQNSRLRKAVSDLTLAPLIA